MTSSCHFVGTCSREGKKREKNISNKGRKEGEKIMPFLHNKMRMSLFAIFSHHHSGTMYTHLCAHLYCFLIIVIFSLPITIFTHIYTHTHTIYKSEKVKCIRIKINACQWQVSLLFFLSACWRSSCVSSWWS